MRKRLNKRKKGSNVIFILLLTLCIIIFFVNPNLDVNQLAINDLTPLHLSSPFSSPFMSPVKSSKANLPRFYEAAVFEPNELVHGSFSLYSTNTWLLTSVSTQNLVTLKINETTFPASEVSIQVFDYQGNEVNSSDPLIDSSVFEITFPTYVTNSWFINITHLTGTEGEYDFSATTERAGISSETQIMFEGCYAEGKFLNDSYSTHYWASRSLENEQIVYFKFQSTLDLLSEDTIEIFSPDYIEIPKGDTNIHLNTYAEYQELIGDFTVNQEGNWYIEVSRIGSMTGNYNLTFYDPSTGYYYTTAKEIIVEENVTDEVFFKGEERYWKIEGLEKNQRAFVTAQELDPNVLDSATMEVGYLKEGGTWNSERSKSENDIGDFALTFRAEQSQYYIKLKHSESYGRTGNYSIFFTKQTEGFSIGSAIPILINETRYITTNYSDDQYYKVEIPNPGNTMTIFINETTAEAVEESSLQVYEPGGNQRVGGPWYEEDSQIDGRIQASFYVQKAGFYYLVFKPSSNSYEGSYTLRVQYVIPSPFFWSPLAFFATIFLCFLSPSLVVLYIKNQNARSGQNYFDLGQIELLEAFEFFRKRNEYTVINDNENTSLEIIYKGSTFNVDYLSTKAHLRFKETDISDSIDSSVLLNVEFSHKLLGEVYIYLIFILLYAVLNILTWFLFHETVLPFRVTDPAQFAIFLPLFAVLLTLYFVTDWWPNYTKSTLLNIIANLAAAFRNEIITEKLNKNLLEDLDRELRYIRVLWNQAKKEFKAENYSMFVIKADATIRKLLGVRYNQFYGENRNNNQNFQNLTESVRNLGFDIPKNRRIKFYRQLRNIIVHSSRVLTLEEAERARQHYSKFLERLGLRP
ncbi:MAG: hypothetical protein ACFFCZ_30290 [Promethearchaeota archaeon]